MPSSFPQPWMRTPEVTAVLNALTAQGCPARFVGGCVRDALLGRPVADIDIATPEPPESVIRLLEQAGIKAVPTGIAHGTVTAVANHRPFEITTLRRDVATDGRHATVAYTDRWEEDAARRDLTFNALYLSPEGELFDYFGGQADLQAGRVRFIGDPATRIGEDVLRILRFFRFYAWLGEGAPDPEGLAACTERASAIARLSGERIRREMFKLLVAPDPVPALTYMRDAGVLDHVEAGTCGLEILSRLSAVERQAAFGPEPVRRLAAMITPEAAQAVVGRWKLSNAEKDRLVHLKAAPPIALDAGALALKKRIRADGKALFMDTLLLQWAGEGSPDVARYEEITELCRQWEIPTFPVTGADLKAHGIAPGPKMGATLKQLEAAWEEAEYTQDKRALLARLPR